MWTTTVWTDNKLHLNLAAFFLDFSRRLQNLTRNWFVYRVLLFPAHPRKHSVSVCFGKFANSFLWVVPSLYQLTSVSYSSTEATVPLLIRGKIQATELEVEVKLILRTISLVIERYPTQPWFALKRHSTNWSLPLPIQIHMLDLS